MKRSRFSDQRIAFVLRQADEGTAIAEVCRKVGGVDPVDALEAVLVEAETVLTEAKAEVARVMVEPVPCARHCSATSNATPVRPPSRENYYGSHEP